MQNTSTIEGLYDSRFEHDACGVGLICNINGEKTHEIIQTGISILINLEHRGACGCDANTGDGAGILIQVPHLFLKKECDRLGIDLPDAGQYGVGLVFLPKHKKGRKYCKLRVEEIIRSEGQRLLGWREVPTQGEHLGPTALEVQPFVEQVFVGRESNCEDERAFERKLYVIRKRLEHDIRKSDLAEKNYYYIPSLSSRTLVYKGMLTVRQVPEFFPDLLDPVMKSALAMVHSRFSTNTFPRWSLAHPFRFLSHNGEINTLRGNINWMNARQALFHSTRFGEDLKKILPIVEEGGSDSAILDNAVELLYHTGRSLPHAMMMLIPEAWQHDMEMSDEKRAFYEYHACMMEPWDGPATISFTDGRYVGALLDRNGLRPSRYLVTKDNQLILSSETGVVDILPERIVSKGRLQPGKMLLVDLEEKRIIDDEEIKHTMCTRKPYREWLNRNLIPLKEIPTHVIVGDEKAEAIGPRRRRELLRLFGYTLEDEQLILAPMANSGKEATGSMGDDTPLAVLSDRPRLLYDYFKQLFAQVTNPPLDAIREELVTSLGLYLGGLQDIFQESPFHCHVLRLDHPILSDEDLAKIRSIKSKVFRTVTLPILFRAGSDGPGLHHALDGLCVSAARAVKAGVSILVLSDRNADGRRAPIPALLATAAVHHHLIKEGLRTKCSLLIESGEPREIHHFCLLIGYGAEAVNPYLALHVIPKFCGLDGPINAKRARHNYFKAIGKGLLKVMSKMGISTLQSYMGAQIFEAIGLGDDVIDRYFTGTPSRLGGIGLEVMAEEVQRRHDLAYPGIEPGYNQVMDSGGRYQYRRDGEYHLFNPDSIATLQQSVRQNSLQAYRAYASLINDQTVRLGTLRGLLEFEEDTTPLPLDEIEPWTEIVKRFKTGAMSYGSISQETHEALAIAMNTIGGRNNTGEGGEDPERYSRQNPRRSRIKQVASGRFGVTIDYLVSADEIQIKMAQGAKPGEGGQLPGEKVYPWIAKTRHSTPYVGLISPPPHHDIYSIEDLAQLILDLKKSNRAARISVKLVSEVGVGTIATGVAKGKADVVLISGYDGGTGASPRTSIAHAGLPWELGLAETHQTLIRNGLRSRIRVECDGQLKTGRDVAVACLLGADEFGFATAPLVTLGCIMMRKCHLNTCPVGVATQDPELRKKFDGKPDYVINYFHFLAEELREIMARLGFRTIDEMVGRVDRLKQRTDIEHWKAKYLDLSPILAKAGVPANLIPYETIEQDNGLEDDLDYDIIERASLALNYLEPVEIDIDIRNTDRAVGTMLSSEVARIYGTRGIPDDTITLKCRGSAGQSFLAFGAKGITAHVVGDANDYFGKGLSGAKLIIKPPEETTFDPSQNILIGNVALYGATGGEVYVRGQAGERFAVRNSGARGVVEGVGDHGCEYMTGGRIVVLGPTGRNFAAGMSGGIAYVLDGTWDFRRGRYNMKLVDLEQITSPEDRVEIQYLVEQHFFYTKSSVALWVLENWDTALNEFVKVIPTGYRKALERLERERKKEPYRELVAV